MGDSGGGTVLWVFWSLGVGDPLDRTGLSEVTGERTDVLGDCLVLDDFYLLLKHGMGGPCSVLAMSFDMLPLDDTVCCG